MEPSENYDVPTEVECKLLKHKYLQDRKSEISKELKNIRVELKSVTRFLNYKAKLQISDINAQGKPTSSSSVPSQIKNDTMGLENDIQLSKLSQFLAPKVPNKKRSRNKAKRFFTNKNKNAQKSVTQNSPNNVNVISDHNMHHIESSRLKIKHKKKSNVNINKNSQTNTIQKSSDSVIVVQNNHSNMVSTSQHTTQATDDCGHHIEDITTPSLQTGNDVCVFHDILARCMTIRNLIDPLLQSHCDPPHSQLGAPNSHRHANSHGLKQKNFCVNTRGKGKKNTIINWYMNWKRNMYRRPMRGSISRGSGSRGRGLGKGRGHNSAFGRGNHHFHPYFNRQRWSNYVSHPEKQNVHPNMNPVNDCLEDKTENNIIEVKDSHVKHPPVQNKNNEPSKFMSSENNCKNNNQKTEKTKTIPQTSSESSNYYHIRKNKNTNKSNRRGLKNGLVENGTKEKTKNKVKQTKHQQTSCSSANNSPIHRGIKKHQVTPVYIPSRRGFRTRGQRPWPARLPYQRPPFYRQFHDFPKDNINLCDKNVKTTGDVTTSDLPKPTEKTTSDNQTSTEISTTISHLPNPVTTSEVMNDYQDNIHTEEIQENPKTLKEKSPEVNGNTTDDSESCLVTNDINTTSVPVSTEHATDLTMIDNIPNETNEANIPEENTETITESNKTDITKSSNDYTKKCVVVVAFEYDDDTSQSNTRVLLNNLNNMEPALKSLLLTVKNQETTKIENFPVKVESTIVKEECFVDSYSSVDVDVTEQSTYNHQPIKSEFIENIHMKDIKIEQMELPDDTDNYNVLYVSPNESESNMCNHEGDQIDDIEATDNITNTISSTPIQTPINISTSRKQNFIIDGEIRNQTIVIDYDYIKTILKNIRSIRPEKLKISSEFDGFNNAEVIATTSTNTLVVNEKQNENKDNYNIISMEVDDDDNNDSDATELLDNLSNISDSDRESENVSIQDIESDIVEIIDIIKTNPTDFETLLGVINSSGGSETDNMLLNDIATAIGDILKNSSSHSLKATMSKEKVAGKRVSGKMSKRQRRMRRLKTQLSIQKLFHQLRDASHMDSQLENSATNSQDSSQASIIDLDDTNTTMIPNELRNNLQTNHDNSVLILDGEQACSTPKRGSLQNLQKPTTMETIVVEDVVLAHSNNRSLNETRMINRSSFQTIDLTTDSGFNRTERSQPTIIEISDACDDRDVTLVSAASSMSGDSDVTVLRQPISRKLKKFTNGIASLNADEKGKLLELITQTIFNGCDVQSTGKQGVANLQRSVGRAAQTAEDTYIKEVILGTKASRSSIGSNIYHPDRQKGAKTGPKMIVIDGSNVAMEHGRGQYFSVRGLQICIDYFLRRGHVVKAFVPRFRCKSGKSSDPRLLDFLERKGLVIYTPSREVLGRTITPYDDRYIIQCAAEFDAVVVSCDNYRDLAGENPRWRSVINTSVLPFTWVDDMIMFPRDPLGRHGPTLEQFLRHPGPEHAVRIN